MSSTQSQIKFKIYIPNELREATLFPEILLVDFIGQAIKESRDYTCIDGTRVSFEESDTIAESMFCVLPHTWNQYVDHGLLGPVIDFVQEAKLNDKYVVVWGVGDLEIVIPFTNIIYFQNGIHRSVKRKPAFSFELPAFWPDYLKIYFDGVMQLRDKHDRPVVGFCGQAASKGYKIAYFAAKNLSHVLIHSIKGSAQIPQPIVPPVVLRNRILKNLSDSNLVETNFIIRDRYRAGVRAKVDRDDYFHQTKVEFVNNIIDTDYTVCVRGGGNFSVRLYETLSCGRIPIFVDTDSRLPYDFVLNWKNYCIWVDYSEISHIAEKVSDFHTRLSNDDFVELQNKCRTLWAEWLFRDAFLSRFCEHLVYVSMKPEFISRSER